MKQRKDVESMADQLLGDEDGTETFRGEGYQHSN